MNMKIKNDYVEKLNIIRDKRVAVVGAGPNLVSVNEISEDLIISADGATNFLYEHGIIPDIIVTDLDGISVFPEESIYVVHAHGDNIRKLYKVNNMKIVIGSAQVFPFGNIHLFGGFTDGDRAVILAKLFKAKEIVLYGMDFDSGYVGKYSKPYYEQNLPANWVKRNKLKIAKQIIEQVLSKDL
ncbi:hypothetical protein STK_05390 [Sulfurisphaera tokodaii str. 7]|uniref:6-hydroxymethyl-7,8-dihydropterin pyrophosphokinase n=2 Tax=Sulfurisphaera tokodaii TaxID=111955 RepID=F9VN27_SULTO|nr:hypothetical protein STK_05390 [Sulfurisphaera tokodaii str. 7]